MVVMVLVAACGECTKSAVDLTYGAGSKPTMQTTKEGNTVPAELVGYNHTENSLYFSVNGHGGGVITAGSGGGSFACCVRLPAPWREGFTVTVQWEDHEGKPHRREVPVSRYDPDTLSDFNVHFLRSGEIKVFALRIGLRHPDYPLTGSEAELKPGVPVKKVDSRPAHLLESKSADK
jgi:hypothetical protein